METTPLTTVRSAFPSTQQQKNARRQSHSQKQVGKLRGRQSDRQICTHINTHTHTEAHKKLTSDRGIARWSVRRFEKEDYPDRENYSGKGMFEDKDEDQRKGWHDGAIESGKGNRQTVKHIRERLSQQESGDEFAADFLRNLSAEGNLIKHPSGCQLAMILVGK